MDFGSKKSSSSAATQDRKKFELLERARLERADRAAKKQQELVTLRLQSIFRGNRTRNTLQQEIACEVTKNLSDIARVQQAVLTATKKPFVLPIKPCNRLAQCMYFLIRRNSAPTTTVVGQFLSLFVDTLAANLDSPVLFASERRMQTLIEFEFCTCIALEQVKLTQFCFANKRRKFEEFIVSLMLRPTNNAKQRLTGNPEITLALFHPAMFSIPGFFTLQTDSKVRAKAHEDSVAVLTFLLSNDKFAVKNDTVIAQFGNLLACQFPLDTELMWQVLLEYVSNRLPQFALAGNEGVGWINNKVAVVNAASWRQIDFYLPALVQRMVCSKLLQVNTQLDSSRVKRDLKEWEAIKTPINSPAPPTFKLNFFSSASWAQKLLGKPTLIVAAAAAGPLQNVTETSRTAASNTPTLFLHPTIWIAYAKFLCALFSRWPPNFSNPVSFAALNSSAFSNPRFVEWFWVFLEDYAFDVRNKHVITKEDWFWTGSFAFCTVASHVLLVTDESELFQGTVLNRMALERCVQKLNQAIYELDITTLLLLSLEDDFTSIYLKRCLRFLSLVRDMHARRPLTRETAWMPNKPPTASAASLFQRFRQTITRSAEETLSPEETIYFTNLHMFWCISFDRKAKLFVQQLALERTIHQPPDEPPTYKLRVRRREAGLKEAVPFFLKANLRKRVYVVFQNEFGALEAGIDARGLFKEFIQTLAEVVFVPGELFAMTMEGDQGLFPNPKRSNDPHQFTFAGKLLGKALFEGIVIQPQFSLFILAKLLGKLVSIGDLASLDAELFKNLLFLKTTELDVKDLDLNFTTTSSLGKEVELFPGGASVEVNSHNKFRYVNAVAHYKLNTENKAMHEAFISGFYSVIQPEWIQHFSERELQMLISGKLGGLDVQDWKANTVYSGGYFATSPTVQWFWQVVENEMTNAERELLLRFATACSRAPLLGFASLDPKFQVQRVGVQDMQLPTSSTCFNTLKLPAYPSKQVLKAKLLSAVNSGAGFELS